jgi:uncharacterized protein
MNTIILAGGSGQVGTVLARDFLRKGHQVVILTRGAPRKEGQLEYAHWDGATLGAWKHLIDGSSAVINLAGRSVNCRYTPANRREILESRVNSTRVIGEAIANSQHPPRVWLQAATAAIYSHRFDANNDEHSGLLGGNDPGTPETWRFSVGIARAWEDALNNANTPNTRKVLLRSSLVMSPDKNGVFDTLLALVRFGLGGSINGGQQFVSWIHDQDFIRSIHFLLEHEDLSGVVNIASPNPLPNADFMRALRQANGSRIGLPSTKWMLQLGAMILQAQPQLMLKSYRVVPQRLLEAGFRFEQPHWETAARDLVERMRPQFTKSV